MNEDSIELVGSDSETQSRRVNAEGSADVAASSGEADNDVTAVEGDWSADGDVGVTFGAHTVQLPDDEWIADADLENLGLLTGTPQDESGCKS